MAEKKTQDQINKELREEWNKLKFDTQQIRAGEDPYPETPSSLRLPIYATKSYVYSNLRDFISSHYYYSRTENPTLYALDKKLATLHGGEDALSVASGMAAVHLACSSILQQRLKRIKPKKIFKYLPQTNPEQVANLIMHKNQYTGTFRLFMNLYPQMGIEPRIVDMRDLNQVKSAIDEQTKLLFIETPANPSIDIIDIQACANLIHEVGGKCIVDNTFASPALQKPLELGADMVVESLTKYINGHGDAMGGVVVGPKIDLQNIRYFWLELEGQVMSPFSAWLILRGCRTLSIRMKKHCENSMKIAQFLESHPKVAKVIYPGLESHPSHSIATKQMSDYGGMLGFELNSQDESQRFIDLLKVIKVGVSLGDTTSLIEYTSVMTGIDLSSWEKKLMNISDRHFRFSIGLEDSEDLVKDLEQALNNI
ncbi:MAG: PLP-dependent transferase [Promethearchaeota archaeon]|nr:MAG: PLP-dependent transferase [Candidatus Lokiarchaeota archaeon]